MDSTVSTLLSRGGLRERCSESIGKFKCLNCGETASTAMDWENNADRCPICLGSERKFACDRCEELFDEPGLGGEHPCRSVTKFERTRAVTFEPEMLATEAERLAAEEAHRREAERLAAEELRRRNAERREVEESRRRRSERLAAEEARRREADRLAAEEARRGETDRLATEEARHREAERLAAEEAHRREVARLAAEAVAAKTARYITFLRKILLAFVGALLVIFGYSIFYKEKKPEFRYEGELQNGKAHGSGKFIGPNGIISEGIFFNNQLIKGIHKGDGFVYEGELLDNKFHGKGVLILPNGLRKEGDFSYGNLIKGVVSMSGIGRYEGDFLNGQRHGKGKVILTDGESQEGEFSNGKLIKGIVVAPDGARYDGEILNDRFHGKGVLIFPNGARHEGEFFNGFGQGSGIFMWPNGNRYVGDFIESKFHGNGVVIWPNGNRYEGKFSNGKFSGNGTYILKNGDRYESNLLDGKILDNNFSYQEKTAQSKAEKLNAEQVTGQPSAVPNIPIPKDANSVLENTNSAITAKNSFDVASSPLIPGQPEAVSLPSSDLRHINIRKELTRISELINFEAISINISAMKTYSHFGNAEQVELAASRLTSLVPMLTRGDRRTARKLNAEALIVMGNSASRAVDLLFEAMKADSADVEIIGNLAYALYQEEKFWEASYACMISLAISPRRASSWSTLALATLKMRDDDDIPSMLTRTDLSIANFKNAYRYSTKPEKTIEFLTTLANSDPDPAVRALALRVLPTLAKVTRIEESNSKTSSTVENAASDMRPGVVFTDCADCPEMVVLPGAGGGSPTMAMGRTEVTQAQWRAVMGINPSVFKQCGSDCPVENVSWNDAQAFIKLLNAKTGKNYTLPTQDEWQDACLGGQKARYCGGNNLDTVAWHEGNSGRTTHRVGTKQANGFGLYDMNGNVWEWTDSNEGNSGQRVLRGGSWFSLASYVNAAIRTKDGSTISDSSRGFRLARMLP